MTNASHSEGLVAQHSSALSNSADGVEEWLELVDQALQGLHHTLNNRIGSLSALLELLQLDGVPGDGSGFDAVNAEVARLEECSRLVRLLPRDRVGGEEALILDDVLADAFAIHRFLHSVREVPVTIVPTRFVEPVRVERWALVRVLTLLLYDAKRLANQLAANVRVVAASDDQWLTVEFRLGASAAGEIPISSNGRYSEVVAKSFGGSVSRQAGVVELRLPTLKARRAADHR
jgi:hypothetical protein